ncbi:MAG TPA: hypothetical protein DCZ95_08790 [Verrucomicrobia bacterium]|nr:MAG: hypothetical protein A2X46_19385 [Lentisphaerae bacterium GWF2_57_35]HBA84173.1 hypothetical protein [Verrucomicrobiota bacterium]
MSKQATAPSKEFSELAEDARVLMEATVHLASDKVGQARKRLAAALERGKSNGESLMGKASDKVGEDVEEVRKLCTAALESGKEIYGDVYDKVVEKAKTADHAFRENLYQTMGIALGVGALVGYLFSRRGPRHGD